MTLINQDSSLRCPKCGADQLNHEAVTVCGRRDDALMVLRTVTENNVSRTDLCDNASSGNPSDRSNGLFIKFRCENCGRADLELTFAQHKGRTYVEWR